jgi:hypothetical protein
MAGERPIVSTANPELKALYGDVISIGRDRKEFIAACEDALALPQAQRHALAARMRAIVMQTSWVSMTDAMHALIALTQQQLAVPGMAA